MRFAELVWRSSASALLLGAAGCASVSEPTKSVTDTVAAATTAVAAAVTPEAPLNPATQRAFDDASRALRAGQTAEAERGFRALAQSNPDLAGPHANLGLIQRQAGKLPESATELERAVKLSPRQPVYLNQLGITYRQQGQFDKARDAYERAIAIDAAYASAILNLGILYDLYLGDAKRAMEQYERYLALTPSGDATVTKWVAELKNRKPAPAAAPRKEKA